MIALLLLYTSTLALLRNPTSLICVGVLLYNLWSPLEKSNLSNWASWESNINSNFKIKIPIIYNHGFEGRTCIPEETDTKISWMCVV